MTWHSAAGLDALPVARLHPLVRDTSRPAPDPDLLAVTELAARPLKAAAEAAEEIEDPPTWSAWQRLAPHAAVVLNSLSALPDSSDETIGAAAGAAYTAARYRASQGPYAAAAAEYGEVFTARLRDLVPATRSHWSVRCQK
ncbi:hypothetical protein ACIBQX_13410 [Nonomuraea sp. NPDC049714]|uniref:hypothetical protein n=1 Tax=Nonomuraea sp. NPDC049714 TaxID=3364357 RepID=UPI00378743D9